jgi:ankyrin repeat protein
MKRKFILFASLIIIGLGGLLLILMFSERSYSRDLIKAIEDSNYDKLEELLEKNGNINAKPYSDFHALFLEIYNDPPIFYAIRKGDINSVRLLLEHDAKVNIVSDYYTPLMETAHSINIERFEIANLLLDYGADIGFVDKWGNTPVLQFNINHNSEDDYNSGYGLFLRFVSLGAIPNCSQQFTYGNFMLYAVTTNNVLIVDYLINSMNCDIRSTGKDGVSALIRATQYNSILVVEYLVDNGVDRAYNDDFNKTAYDYAVEKNYTEIMNILEP